jgi:hypothetical protein
MAPGGIRTHDPSKRLATDLRLRPRGHWDRLFHVMDRAKDIERIRNVGSNKKTVLRTLDLFPAYLSCSNDTLQLSDGYLSLDWDLRCQLSLHPFTSALLPQLWQWLTWHHFSFCVFSLDVQINCSDCSYNFILPTL